jgi:hypothetical protein
VEPRGGGGVALVRFVERTRANMIEAYDEAPE